MILGTAFNTWALISSLRPELDDAEAAEAKAVVAFDEAKTKAGELAAKLGALKGAGAATADVPMAPGSATVVLESTLGKVRKLVQDNEAKAKG